MDSVKIQENGMKGEAPEDFSPSQSESMLNDAFHIPSNAGEMPIDLEEGVQFYPALKATSSSSSMATSVDPREIRSTVSLRLETLARPKAYCLENTLQQFGYMLGERSVQNLNEQIQAQNSLHKITSRVHLKQCIQDPVQSPPKSRRPRLDKERAANVEQKLATNNKREAFDRLAETFFRKLPSLVLDANIEDLSQLSTERKRLINTLYATIVKYAGVPLAVHDHELYLHMCVGLAQFVESVIAGVRNEKDVAQNKSNTTLDRRDSMTTKILRERSGNNAAVQLSREILKTKLYK
ncbi:uncharacterized protein LOC129730557 [Wyeomyia smithii]|uniref:uncharacterized protein LOC129730557 n=1 Tax=Wyeomyia smithii TaxID=174621 RepID=UPI002467D58C|nr:uncharacterized protein LOC129730557 [Wyeomyia smithii]